MSNLYHFFNLSPRHVVYDIWDIIKDCTISFLTEIIRIGSSYGYCRAAGELSRAGLHKEAKELMLYSAGVKK